MLPLLNLPLVVSNKVVKQIELDEQYHLVFLSSRAEKLVRISNLKSGIALNMQFSEGFGLQILKPINDTDEEKFCFQIISRANELKLTRGFVCVTNDARDTLKKQLKRVINAFQPRTMSIELTEACAKLDFIVFLFNLIRELEIKVYGLMMIFVSGDNELLKFVIESSATVVKSLHLVGPHPSNFNWELETVEPSNFKSCMLRKFNFVNSTHLINTIINCERVILLECEGMNTALQLNSFVKAWIRNSKLQYFRVGLITSINNLSLVIDDVRNTPVSEAYQGCDLLQFSPGNAFKIQQDDGGQEAVIFLDARYFVLTTFFGAEATDGDRYEITYL